MISALFALLPMIALFAVDIFLLFTVPWFAASYVASSIFMHSVGGVCAAWSLWRVCDGLPKSYGVPRDFWRVYMVWASTGCIVIAWEWYEFALDMFFGSSHQLGLTDTMIDMALGIFGAGLFCLYTAVFLNIRRT
jgi:hypothetical protein